MYAQRAERLPALILNGVRSRHSRKGFAFRGDTTRLSIGVQGRACILEVETMGALPSTVMR